MGSLTNEHFGVLELMRQVHHLRLQNRGSPVLGTHCCIHLAVLHTTHTHTHVDDAAT
jgi:hypothetical protein